VPVQSAGAVTVAPAAAESVGRQPLGAAPVAETKTGSAGGAAGARVDSSAASGGRADTSEGSPWAGAGAVIQYRAQQLLEIGDVQRTRGDALLDLSALSLSEDEKAGGERGPTSAPAPSVCQSA